MFPSNDIERALVEALADPSYSTYLVRVVSDGDLWVPVSPGNTADDAVFTVVQLNGAPYIPVFSSEEQLYEAAGGVQAARVSARQFARMVPPAVGFAINPGGQLPLNLPPEAVLEIARKRADSPVGARVGLGVVGPDEARAFLGAVCERFVALPVVLTARMARARIENDPPCYFVGVELDRWLPADREQTVAALEQAVEASPPPFPVNLVFLDLAQDPVGDWMHDQLAPFYARNP